MILGIEKYSFFFAETSFVENTTIHKGKNLSYSSLCIAPMLALLEYFELGVAHEPTAAHQLQNEAD